MAGKGGPGGQVGDLVGGRDEGRQEGTVAQLGPERTALQPEKQEADVFRV